MNNMYTLTLQSCNCQHNFQASKHIRIACYIIYIIIIIIIITSNDDPKPSTVISEQLPTGLIARHIKITPGTIIS